MDNINKEYAPLVSIGLMTYNREHWIRGAIESWLWQTFRDFELIISDDASTDGTQKICEEYAAKDKRIRYFRQPKNLNQPLCFTFVLGQARGKYFMFASDDDLWDGRFLEDCLRVYNERPDVVGVLTGMVDIDVDGKPFGKFNPKEYVPDAKDPYERLKQYVLFYNDIGKLQWLYALYKRDILMEDFGKGPYFGLRKRDDYPPMYWGFDNFFDFRNLAKGPFGFSPAIRFYRRHPHYRPAFAYTKRPLVLRIAISLCHRAEKIFLEPYYWYIAVLIAGARGLSVWQKLKLIWWNFYTAGRLFFVRKL